MQLPAVAGAFYPANARALSRMIDDFLDQAHPAPMTGLRALICPHAGYPYSGPVAAHAYKLLLGLDFKTVLVMGPSHYAHFTGAALPRSTVFRTPLGDIKVSPEAARLGPPFVVDPPCRVQRPDWWDESGADPSQKETPFTWEHSVEVQLPFLQKTLPSADVIPVLCGVVDPLEMARALALHLDDQTLVVASSDLSHYHTHKEATRRDAACVQAICDLDVKGIETQEACGSIPVAALMHLARMKGWKTTVLDCRNSGDTAGTRDAVVGYAAIAFWEVGTPSANTFTLDEQRWLLDLARQTLQAVTRGEPLPTIESQRLPSAFHAPRGCFVTLTKGGELRGCIGHILPQEPLWKAVMDNTRAASLRDARFRPVTADEAEDLHIEISILTVPEPLNVRSPEDLLAKLRPHEDGVVLKHGLHQATFLPQVWKQLPQPQAFLAHLSSKAGGPADLWQQSGTQILTYRVTALEECRQRHGGL